MAVLSVSELVGPTPDQGAASTGKKTDSSGAPQGVKEVLYSIRHENLVDDSAHRINRETGQVEELAGIDKNLHRMMVSTLGKQMKLILNLRGSSDSQERELFDQLMADPNHQAEASLLDMVLDNDRKAIDYNKIGDLLREQGVDDEFKTGEGWKLAMTVIEHNMTRQMYALGMAGALKYHGKDSAAERGVRPQDLALSMSIDQSTLNRILQKSGKAVATFVGTSALGGWLGGLAGYAASSLPFVTTGSALIGIGSGLGVAAGPLAFIGAPAVWGKVRQSGYKIDMKGFADGLATIQGNPIEQEFMAKSYGVDAGNFRVDGDGKIQIVHAENYKSVNIAKKQEELLKMMLLRTEAYKAMGVDLSALDAFPEQSFVTHGDTSVANRQAERTGALHAREIDQRYFEICQAAGGVPATTQEQLKLRQQARVEVMGKMVQELLLKQREAAKNDSSDAQSTRLDIAKLDSQIASLKGDPDKAEQMGARAKKASEQAQKDQKMYEDVKSILDEHETKRSEYEEARLEIESLLNEARDDYGASTVADIEAEIARRHKLTPEELQRLRDQLETSRGELKSIGSEAESAVRFTDRIKNDYAKFIGPAVDATSGHATSEFGLDPAFLSTESIDDIFQKINALHQADISAALATPRGWAATENHKSGVRLRVMGAITEARALQRDPSLKTQNELGWVLATKATSGISESKIQNMSPDELVVSAGMVTPAAGVASRPLNRAEAITVIMQSRHGVKIRSEAWKSVRESEAIWVENHNSTLDAERNATQAEITALKKDKTDLETIENEIKEAADIDNIADSIDRKFYGAFNQDINRIAVFVAETSGQPFSLEESQDIDKMSFAEVVSRINAANGATPRVAGTWDQSQNSNPDNVRAVVAFLADARAKKLPQLASMDINLKNLVDIGFAEQALIGHKADDYITASGRDKGLKAALIKISSDVEVQRAILTIAITEAESRHGIRSAKLAEILRESATEATRVQVEKDAGNALSPEEMLSLDAAECHIIMLGHDSTSSSNLRKLQTDQLALKKRLKDELALTDLAEIADITAAISARDIKLKSLNEYKSIDPDLTAISTPLDALLAKLDERMKAEKEASTALGINSPSLAELDRQIADQKKHPTARLEEILAAIKDKQKRIEMSHEDVAPMLKTYEDGRKNYDKFTTTFDAVLTAAPPIPERLDQAALSSLSYKEITRRINLAHERDQNIGWSEKDNDNHKEEVLNAVLEAKMRHEVPNLVIAEANFDRLTAADIGITETQLLTLTEPQIQAKINEANRRTPAAGWAQGGNVANLHIVQAAVTEAKRRFALRTESASSTELVEEFDQSIIDAKDSVKAAIENLAGDKFYVETVRDMAAKSDRRLFPWVKDWAGPEGEGRNGKSYLPVSGQDEEYSKAERFDSARAPRLLPKGYYDMLQAMTGYQDLVGSNREAKFEELFKHSEFKPEAIFNKLNIMLGLGLVWAPGVDLFNAFVEIRSKFNFNNPPPTPPSLSGLKVHDKFEDMVDTMINRAVAL